MYASKEPGDRVPPFAHDDREFGPVQKLRLERLRDGRVFAIVLSDDRHAPQHEHVEDAHAPAGARGAEAELGAQHLRVPVELLHVESRE